MVEEEEDYIVNLEKTHKDKMGLYQAYGDSIIYGANSLLYIGLTTDFYRRTDCFRNYPSTR